MAEKLNLNTDQESANSVDEIVDQMEGITDLALVDADEILEILLESEEEKSEGEEPMQIEPQQDIDSEEIDTMIGATIALLNDDDDDEDVQKVEPCRTSYSRFP